MGFLNRKELKKIGFKLLGNNVLISDKCSIYSPEKMIIGNNVRIDDFCILSGKINIGSYVHIAAYTALFGNHGIKIEDFVGLSSRVSVYSASDDYSGESLTNPMIPEKYKKITTGEVVIKKHSIIGAGTIILPKVSLGEGTSIGANSLVIKSTEPWYIYAGNPIKKIKEKSKNLLIFEKKFLREEIEKNG